MPNSSISSPENRIPPCPSSPNCVSSASGTDTKHFVQPMTYAGPLENARTHLLAIIEAMPRTRIIRNDSHYLHVECASRIFRFIDDLEFWFESGIPLIHVRSASRVGYSDLGVNRTRVETIRSQLAKRVGSPGDS